MDMVLEVGLRRDSVHILSSRQHVFQQLLEGLDELDSWRLEGHCILIHIKSDCSLDPVLFGTVLHFMEDFGCRFLVNADLGLKHHVVDETDVGTESTDIASGEHAQASTEFVLLGL